uniref:glycerophosphocholine cholinephosphodiesterase n=1 Tax=Hadrurus spadix TaxID=141984 RepID=A0A1W7RA20_9SCOR
MATTLFSVLCMLVFVAFFTTTLSHPGPRKNTNCLIIVLVDGVRWDYIKEDEYKGFEKIAKHGVKAEYVDPIFPSNSYPNWYTIVTGKYAESHGFVQNFMYDKVRNDIFKMSPSPNASHVHWWNGSEPLWITAEKNGIRTGMYWWDGCQVTLSGITVSKCKNYTYYKKFDVNKDTKKAFLEALDDCEKGDRRLGLVYYEPVDGFGHEFGPDSQERKMALKAIDSILTSVQEKIEKKKLKDKVNLVVVSDHGMANSNPDRVVPINISTPAILDNIEMMLDKGSMSMIMPKEGKLDQLYRNLIALGKKGLHIYKKDDIPNHYHFKNNNLVLPVLLVADQGFFIQRIPGNRMYPNNNIIYNGFHGYDPFVKNHTDMRGIFYARGPDFKKKYVSQPLSMVDHYQIFCHLLGIQALPNNGSWDKVKNMLRSSSGQLFPVKYLIVAIHIILIFCWY